MKLYVGNLSYAMTETELSDLFTPFGTVESAKIITDRYSGRSKGFAFVEMPNGDEGKKAIEDLNGKEFKQRALIVNEARPQENSKPKGGPPRRRF